VPTAGGSRLDFENETRLAASDSVAAAWARELNVEPIADEPKAGCAEHRARLVMLTAGGGSEYWPPWGPGHQQIICDGCKQSPLLGNRYKVRIGER
jgi:hypothetical protein